MSWAASSASMSSHVTHAGLQFRSRELSVMQPLVVTRMRPRHGALTPPLCLERTTMFHPLFRSLLVVALP